MTDELRRRLIVAGVLIPACVLVVFAGGWLFAGGLSLLAGVAMREFGRMQDAGRRPYRFSGVLGAAGFPLVAFGGGLELAWLLVPGFLMAVSVLAFSRDPPEEGPVLRTAVTIFGVLYVGGLLSFAVPIRTGGGATRGAATLFFFLPVTVTWLSDSAAYFGGKALGRRPLAPRISPNKTVAGAVSALVAGIAGGGLYGVLVLPLGGAEALAPAHALALGLAVAGAAILGDLAESVLKRECGVKDSSDLLPGHGGLLDRMDSLLWVFPVAHAFLRLT